MTHTLLIRETIPEDQSAIEKMMTEFVRDQFKYTNELDIMPAAAVAQMKALQGRVMADGGLIYVAEVAEILVGFVLVLFEDREDLTVREAYKSYARLTTVYVKKAHRLSYIATKLHHDVEAHVRKLSYEKLKLEVTYMNKDAVKFFQTLGYKVTALTLEK
ncbi:GNAT family N-acetyltransferase [Temperatibacter marinus]|uniref:GNAT family N-acetyltransferase n=1 Tax=Temperatibacter marinus TaxID=1456591 RepID=A0AA52EI64_9PROT|nr:GNAT family N-acetyltransferase [Temperatibacter marinus]WND03618.1 GNAT family N-acetyltransferase [Temperatibacter marinus]